MNFSDILKHLHFPAGGVQVLFYFHIGNCSKATGHRSKKIYDAVCPDKCSPPAAFIFERRLFYAWFSCK